MAVAELGLGESVLGDCENSSSRALRRDLRRPLSTSNSALRLMSPTSEPDSICSSVLGTAVRLGQDVTYPRGSP